MKAKMTKIAFSTYLLLTNFILFAKDDGGDILEGDGTIENNGPSDPTPINSQLIWLVILGLAFAYYIYKTKKIKA